MWDDDTSEDPLPVNRWHREIDVEVSKWGVPSTPPVSFTIQPWSLDGTTRNTLASHLTRIDAATDSGGELGRQGGGACDAFGPGSFNGASIQTLTFVIVWLPERLQFYYFDGDVPMQQLASKVPLGTWTFKGAIPTTNAANPALGVHMHLCVQSDCGRKANTNPPPPLPPPPYFLPSSNLWQCNWGGVPDYKRIVHNVITSFDYSSEPVALPPTQVAVLSTQFKSALAVTAVSIFFGIIFRAVVQYALMKRPARECEVGHAA